MRARIGICAILVVVAGCGGPPAGGAPAAPAEAAQGLDNVANTDPLPGADGWSSYAAATGPALVYRDQDAALMELSCIADAGLLGVSGALGGSPPPSRPGETAAIAFAGKRFSGAIEPAQIAGHSVAITVPLTADLVRAMRTADTARLIRGGAFIDTNPGGGAQLAGFARMCAVQAGLSH
jgi:hypothetical protein